MVLQESDSKCDSLSNPHEAAWGRTGLHAMRAHQAGSATPESVPRGRISNLGNVSDPGPRHPTRSQAMA